CGLFATSTVPAQWSRECPPLSGWLPSDETSRWYPVLWRASKQEKSLIFVIGIDPHKGSHAAAVIDGDECVAGVFSSCHATRSRTGAAAVGAPPPPAHRGRTRATIRSPRVQEGK